MIDFEPTLAEQVRALEATVAALTAERDRERARADAETKRADAFEQQIDHMQNPTWRPDDHTNRWPIKRIDNAL